MTYRRRPVLVHLHQVSAHTSSGQHVWWDCELVESGFKFRGYGDTHLGAVKWALRDWYRYRVMQVTQELTR